MKGFDVLKVKSAVKTHNEFDLSRTHLTTMDFGQIVPLFVEETVPGDSFSIDGEYFSRMAPLVKPTYGKFSFKTVAGFVPYHQIAVDSDAWMSGKTTWEGITPVQRYFTLGDLFDFMQAVSTGTGATVTNCDFTYVDANGVTQYKLFTLQGRYYIKVLNALGYGLPTNVDFDDQGGNWNVKDQYIKLSAYPLLAFVKLYNDYMSQSTRYNSAQITDYLRKIKYGIDISGMFTASTGRLTASCILNLISAVELQYENDYFTSAWQTPSNAINSVESLTGISDIPGSSSTIRNSVNDTFIDTPVVSNATAIGQRALDFLKSFEDWVRRNNYSGSRAVQQIYSRFGIKTDDYKSHYAQVITTDTLPVQVGDVTSTADTAAGGNGLQLGDYAGKGILSGNKSVSIKVSDYGLIVILGYYTVNPMNAYGFDRRVLRNSPLDYYNPEFDGLGGEAISQGELWSSPIGLGSPLANDDVFGYTERYNSYRYGRDVITGDFRNFHANSDMNTWHTGRNLEVMRLAGSTVAQSYGMQTVSKVNSEYNRIFSVTSGDIDHFYVTCRFKVKAVRPMLNLNQVPRLGEGDTTVPRNGNVIS